MVFSHKTHRKEKGLGNRKNVEHLSRPLGPRLPRVDFFVLSQTRESERVDTQQGGGGDGAKSVEWILFDHLEGAE